jgi:CVNH domain
MSIKQRTIGWMGGVLLLCAALPAAAQDGSAAPRGTYLQTCSQIHFDGRKLVATCNHPGWPRQKSAIDVSLCGGDIWNENGSLYCYARQGSWGRGRAIPRGSYVDSCGATIVSGVLLQSRCKGRNGEYNDTSLELTRCRMGTNISNIDGQLVCIN